MTTGDTDSSPAVKPHLRKALETSSDPEVRYHLRQALQLVID